MAEEIETIVSLTPDMASTLWGMKVKAIDIVQDGETGRWFLKISWTSIRVEDVYGNGSLNA